MTATVTLTKVANVQNTWEGDGFIVTFDDVNFKAVVMNDAGEQRTLWCDEEVGVYGDGDYVIFFENGVPFLDMIAYDEFEYDGE